MSADPAKPATPDAPSSSGDDGPRRRAADGEPPSGPRLAHAPPSATASVPAGSPPSPPAAAASPAAELPPQRHPVEAHPTGRRLAILSLTALGVVYGDIGTSP